jgi:hypothetical protein
MPGLWSGGRLLLYGSSAGRTIRRNAGCRKCSPRPSKRSFLPRFPSLRPLFSPQTAHASDVPPASTRRTPPPPPAQAAPTRGSSPHVPERASGRFTNGHSGISSGRSFASSRSWLPGVNPTCVLATYATQSASHLPITNCSDRLSRILRHARSALPARKHCQCAWRPGLRGPVLGPPRSDGRSSRRTWALRESDQATLVGSWSAAGAASLPGSLP